MNVVELIDLLVLAAIAVQWDGVNFLWIGANVLIIDLLIYWIYARVKRRAEAGEWCVPEMQLHLLELASGFSGAATGAAQVFQGKLSVRVLASNRAGLAVRGS
jgi:uncharacterized membrane protein YsdA (DUF1294 family)